MLSSYANASLLLYKQNWLQFVFVVKVTALKQQIYKTNYLQIQLIEGSYHADLSLM